MLRRRGKKRNTIDPQYIVSPSSHHVSKEDISNNALTVFSRLHKAGFQAFIVGGSVRDLLIRRKPKDFDIATDATPNEVKSSFRYARIIGRRFKLVHVVFNRDIIEVATFRGGTAASADQTTNDHGMLIRDNVFGTLEEDAWRRDFTINALYYRPSDSVIVDFTGGFEDIQRRQIRVIGSPEARYQEDPVRMLRAIRFAGALGFTLEPETEAPIKKLSHLLSHVSNSRLFEEVAKLYQCGHAVRIHELLTHYGMFPLLFPLTAKALSTTPVLTALIQNALQNTDARVKINKPVTPAFLFAVFLWFPFLAETKRLLDKEPMPPAIARAKAASRILSRQAQHVSIPKRFTAAIRDIWQLQFQLPKRRETQVHAVLVHPRFRAAYDFLALRAIVGDAPDELADWWTVFQEVSPDKQAEMLDVISPIDDTEESSA